MLLIYMVCLTLLMSTFTKEKRDAYFAAIVVWTCTAFALNEILSIGYNLDFVHLLVSYIVLTVVALGLFLWRVRTKSESVRLDVSWFKSKPVWERRLLGALGVFFFVIFVMSLVMIPHVVDSMTYNLTRIAYWAQNKSVAHYATNDVRAVTTSPLAEFINLQVYILHDKSDLLFNLLQSTSYITNAWLVWCISKKLKISNAYSYLAVLLYISMPIAFAEAFTTQIEQFATIWLLLFVYFILDLLEKDFRFTFSSESLGKVLILGACIAFGYMTKLSVLFGMLVFAVWLLVACIRRKDNFKAVFLFVVIAAVEMVVLVMPEIARNLETFHAVSASSVGAKHMIDTFNPAYMLINALKNACVNLPNIYFPWIADMVCYAVKWLAIKLNVNINDPSIAHDGAEFYLREAGWYKSDSAVNPILLYLTALVFVWLVIKLIRTKKADKMDCFSWAGILSFITFCFALKFEAYSTRYMLSYFALLCPVAAGTIAQFTFKKVNVGKLLVPVIAFMCFVDLTGMFIYHGKICVGHLRAEDRIEGYFEFRENDEENYRQLGEYLATKEYDDMGVYLAWKAGEYPIWKLVDEDVHIEAVNVKNETAIHMDPDFVPDYIVVKDEEPTDIENYLGKDYRLEENFGDMIYLYKLYE